MYKQLKLPPFLEVKKCIGTGPRKMVLFAKEPIEQGTKIMTREIHVAGISGKTVNDIRSVCHNCLARIGNAHPVVCRGCKIVSYCSVQCLKKARSLHAIECKGIVALEKLRGKVSIDVPRPSAWPVDYENYWPPVHALLAARVINKGIMNIHQEGSDWVDCVSIPKTLPQAKVKVFAQMEEYVRLIVPEVISDREIKESLLAVSVNASSVEDCPQDTSIVALYNVEYYLLNHLCKPNCGVEKGREGTGIFACDKIEAGMPLGISFVTKEYYMNYRSLRCAKLKECFGFDCSCYKCEGEKVPGSKLWVLDMGKSSLIAPWSVKTAEGAMLDAWKILSKCETLKAVSPSRCIELLEPSLKKQSQIIDRRNIMRLLTTISLLLRYCQIEDAVNAVSFYHENIDIELILDYGTRRDVAEVTGNLSIQLLELKQISEFSEMFQLTREMHPRRPSTKQLCEILDIDSSPIGPLTSDVTDVEHTMKNLFQIVADSHGLPRELCEQQFRQLVGNYDQWPSLSQMLDAVQNLYPAARTT